MSRPPVARARARALGLGAATLGGLAGLALEVLWLAALGPALGHGRAAPVGLGLWVAGWALGAAAAGAAAAGAAARGGLRPRRRPVGDSGRNAGFVALCGGLLSAGASATVLTALLLAPAKCPALLAALGVLATAAGQGAALPLLAGAFGVRTVWAVNLAGSVLGARAAAWELPAALGRDGATWTAAACAALAGVLARAALSAMSSAARTEDGTEAGASLRAVAPAQPGGSPAARARGAALALTMGIGTAWIVVVQGAAVRLAGVWLGGHQDATAMVLVASLGGLALGAASLAPLLPRGRVGVAVVVALGAGGTVLVGLGPGAFAPHLGLDAPELARKAPLALAALLVAPALVPLGALVPALARCLGPGARGSQPSGEPSSEPSSEPSGEHSGEPSAEAAGPSQPRASALGALLLHEAWGGLAAALLFPFVLVPRLGLAGALGAALAATAAACAALASLRPGGRAGSGKAGRAGLGVAGAIAAGGAIVLLRAPSPVLASPALANPAFTRLAFTEDADYAVTVVDDGLRGERTLLTDDFRATATGPDYLYMQALGHVPLLLHPEPRRVAVLALGTGTTVGAVARHRSVERIDVLELSRAVVAAAPHFAAQNGEALAEGLPGLLDPDDGVGRVVVHLGDGRRALRELADREGAVLDVLTMEPLLPDAPFAVHLYTEGFYREAQRALAPGGLVCQWVPPHALAPEVLEAVCQSFHRAHPWSAAFLHGTQLLLIGGAAEPTLDAARHSAAAIAFAGPVGGASAEAAAERGAPLSGAAAPSHSPLVELALDSPASLAALLVACPAAVVSAGAAPRPLTDADPWILYRPRPQGGEAAGYLPASLARLRAHTTALPAAWSAVVGEAGERRRELALGVLACREAWSAHRAGAVGAHFEQGADLAEVDRRRRALAGHPDESFPPVRWLDHEVRFEHATSLGLGALVGGDARRALELLTRAAEVRPLRADAHLHVAAAASRAGQGELAARALGRALELCPRALETRAGRRALELGLASALAAPDLPERGARSRPVEQAPIEAGQPEEPFEPSLGRNPSPQARDGIQPELPAPRK